MVELNYLVDELLPSMEESGQDTAAIRRLIEHLECKMKDDILC